VTDGIEPVLADGSTPVTPAELLARLDVLGIAHETASHPPVFTVDEARALRGSLPGAHTKNLFVRDKKGAMWLIVTLEDRPVNLNALAAQLGHKRFSFGSPTRLMSYLGVIPGAVTPFALVNDRGGLVRLAMDTGLRDFAVWNFHPLDNAMTTTVDADAMLRFLESVGHPPCWVDIGVSSSGDAGG
jgi:Ala-tRNA(Pro) deacylase